MNARTVSAHPPRDTIGLVLSAGGVRGCAHAGVVEVLRREGIPIDLVVGASVGAIFGLGIAAGVPTEHLSDLTRRATAWDLFRFYAARLRTDRRNPIARLVYEAGDGKTFDDLEIPFAVVVTDMASGLPTVIKSGPVLPAVEASFALPFVARPVRLDSGYYLDGGIREDTPIYVARDMGVDRVIAVHLGLHYSLAHARRQPSWTRALAERLGKQRRPISSRFGDQLRFGCRLYLASADPVPLRGEADVSIRPHFEGVGPNSITGGRYCYEQGIQAARAALPLLRDWPRVPVHPDRVLEEVT